MSNQPGTCGCGAILPERAGPGRPRKRCAACGPSQVSPGRYRACGGCSRPVATSTRSAEIPLCRECRGPRAVKQPTGRTRTRRPTVCEVCSGTYRPRYTGQRTCGRKCGGILRARNLSAKPKPAAKPKPRKIVHCKICESTRRAGQRWRSYCSDRCRLDAAGLHVNGLYAVAVALGINGAPWLDLLRRYLRDRDGDDCQICRRRIRWDLPSGPLGHPSGLGPSIDHVVPRSVEVNDDPANLRLAHWVCNRERKAGRKGETTQLALIG